VLIQLRPPRHELEAEPVVDHREAPGREGDALAADAGDVPALGRGPMRQPGLGRELGCRLVKLPLAQPIQQVTGDDPLPLTAGQTCLDQIVDAKLHRLAHLGAEPTAGRRQIPLTGLRGHNRLSAPCFRNKFFILNRCEFYFARSRASFLTALSGWRVVEY
jgi:hypothetical protein